MTALGRQSPMQPAEEKVTPGGLGPGHLRKQLGLLDSEAQGLAPPVCQPMKAMVCLVP